LNIKEYAPGKPLPPHLSPFVASDSKAYKPDREIEIETSKGKAIVDDNDMQVEESDEE